MAKPSTAHDGAPAATAPTTRRTRSQSAEPTEVARSASRGSRAASESAEGTAPAKKQGRKTKKTASTAPELSAVVEDEEIDEEAQNALLEAQLRDDDEPFSGGRASTAFSQISGTTAHTSFSQEELSNMDSEIMIDVLPDLVTASDRLAMFLLPNGVETNQVVWKEIRQRGSRHQKLYERRMASISIHKEHFSSLEYIRPSIALRAFLGVEDITELPVAARRPDVIFYKINLVQMMNRLLVTCVPNDWSDQTTDVFARLVHFFPEVIAGDKYDQASLEFWLNLATHRTIAELKSHSTAPQSFDHEAIIGNVFYNGMGEFHYFHSLGIAGASNKNRETALQMIQKLVDVLKQPFDHFGDAGAEAAIDSLTKQFRWDALIDHSKRYYNTRARNLDLQIAKNGGVDRILSGLTAEVERRANARKVEEVKEQTRRDKSVRKSFPGKAAIALLKQKEKEISATAPVTTPTTAATTAPATAAVSAAATAPPRPLPETTIGEDVPTRGVVEDELPQPAARPAATQQPKPAPPPRRLIDPQPNAQRISANFDEDDEQSQRPRPTNTVRYEVPASSTLGKRTREEDEDVPDPTPDDGFQTDTRDFAAANERRAQLAARQPAFRVRPSASVEPGPSNWSNSSGRPSPAKRQRTNPGSSIPAPPRVPSVDDGPLTASERYARAKVEAKLNRVATQPKAPQVRKQWSDDEENALLELIEEHGGEGVSYSALKAYDATDSNHLASRSAEDLRFKARNMKVTYLLANGVLPDNWEHVVLSKKEIDRLEARGIAYHQERQRRGRASTTEFEINE